jgi:hypothetical protein
MDNGAAIKGYKKGEEKKKNATVEDEGEKETDEGGRNGRTGFDRSLSCINYGRKPPLLFPNMTFTSFLQQAGICSSRTLICLYFYSFSMHFTLSL